VHVDAIHPLFTDGFDITFAPGSRLFSTATVTGFTGVQLLPVPGNDYAVEVVYGEPVPGGLPDSGRTSGLLAGAVVMLGFARRLSTCPV
jgi:hypothetical protein